MMPYIFVNIIILFLSFISVCYKSKQEQHELIIRQKIDVYLFLIPTLLLLAFFSSFRGNFATDYDNYLYIYNSLKEYSFKDILFGKAPKEVGYSFLNWLTNVLFEKEIFIIIITSIITLLCFFYQYKKDSVCLWLTLLMFVNVGCFYTSFNLIRQVMAVSMVFAGSKYLYEKSFFKYLIIVFFAALFHMSIYIMIIFYFILNIKFSIKNCIIILILTYLLSINLDYILTQIQLFVYKTYTSESYGMEGYNFKNVLLPLSFLLFVILHYKLIDLNNNKINIWMNAVVYYAVFSLLGLKVQMIQRFAIIFSPYALLIVTTIVSQIKNDMVKVIYIYTIIIFSIIYNYITISGGYGPFYFIWTL